ARRWWPRAWRRRWTRRRRGCSCGSAPTTTGRPCCRGSRRRSGGPVAERYRVLIPILTTRRAPELMRVGAAILQHRGGTGSLLGVVEVARGQPISRGITVARRYRRLLNRITAIGESSRAVFGVEVRVAHNLALGIRE